MRFFSKVVVSLFLFLMLVPAAWAADGKLALILKDGDKFRAELSSAGTVLKVTCDGHEMVSGNAYTISTDIGNQSANGNVLVGLSPSAIGGAGTVKPGRPYYKKLPNTTVWLTQTGMEGTVPVFDEASQVPPIPDGTEISVYFDNKLTAKPVGLCLHSTWTHEKGTCKICVLRKLYNTCRWCLTLFSYKEFFKPAHTGLFTQENEIAQVAYRDGDFLCHLFFSNPDQAEADMGSVGVPNFLEEFGATFPTEFFSLNQEEGDRWLEGFFPFGGDGGTQFCPTVRGRAVEKFILWCLDLQCELEPPGDPECPPGDCCCDPCHCCQPCDPPGDPGDEPLPCPEWLNWWCSHQSLWTPVPLALGSQSYNAAEIKTLLTSYGMADVSKALARELIMAKFNVARGSDPGPIAATIAAADTFLTGFPGKLPYGISLVTANGLTAVKLFAILEAYNMRKLTPDCIEVIPPPPGGENPPGDPGDFCPKTQGFWKNHASEWPVASLVLGSKVYSKAELLVIFNTPVGGDASLNLAHQLIAYKLNLANGAPLVETMVAIEATADFLLALSPGKLPYGISPATVVGAQMIGVKTLLDNYNNGVLTPDCGD